MTGKNLVRFGASISLVAVSVACLAGCTDSAEPASVSGQPSSTTPSSTNLQDFSVRPVVAIRKGAFLPKDCLVAETPAADEQITVCFDEDQYVLGKQALGPDDVASVEPSEHSVIVRLDDAGTAELASLTERAAASKPPQNQLALMVAGEIVSAPTVAEPINGGVIQIPT